MTHDAPQPTVSLNAVPGLRREIVLQTHAPDQDLVSHKLHAQQQWEPFETRLWVDSQEPDDVVVDIGANLGYFSILSALHQAPAGRIFAFEPAADNLHCLRRNLVLNGCENAVTVAAVALSDHDSPGILHRSASNRGDHQIYAGDGPRVEETIMLRHGGDYLSAAVDRIDLLKIDTQGSELQVVRGLLPLLQASVGHLRLLIELTPFSLRLAGGSGRELITLLGALDLPFWIVDHIEHQLVSSTEHALAQWCDNVQATPNDRGFMNIYLGYPPPSLLPDS